MSSQFVPEHRRSEYKNKGKFGVDELRRRRETQQVDIRRQKRQDNASKRRTGAFADLGDTAGSGTGPSEIHAQLSQTTAPTADDEEFLARMPDLLEKVMTGDEQQAYEATQAFRRALSREDNPPIQEVINSGVVPRFVEFMSSPSEELVFEASWALTNIASGNSKQTAVILEAGALPKLVELLSSSNSQIQEQAVWALGNIAGDSSRYRDLVMETGALPKILPLLSSTRISLVRTITWTLSNFCRGRAPQPDWEQVKIVIPHLAKLLYHQDSEVVSDACWSVSFLSDGSNDKIQAVIDAGIPRRLVELLARPNELLQSPALRSLGNIVTGDDVQTQTVINAGALPQLAQVLSSRSESLRKEACWTLSNITAGTPQQVQAVIDANLIPQLIHLVATAEFRTRREACWALSNATSGALTRPDQIRYFVQQGCIKPLCDMLSASDTRVVNVALDGLVNILKVGELEKDQRQLPANEYAIFIEEAGGSDMLAELQQSPNEEIYQRAFNIITQYFSEEDAEFDAGVEPSQSGGFFNFGG